MKRFLLILFTIPLILSGCSSNETDKKEVTFNIPSDNTINGYLSSEKAESQSEITSMPDVIPADDAAIVDNKASGKTIDTAYCGNVNSKLFHLSTCSFAVNMREENKAYYYNRQEFISNGYTPCSRCKP